MNRHRLPRWFLLCAAVGTGTWSTMAPAAFAGSPAPQFGGGPSLGSLVEPLLFVVLLTAAAFWIRRKVGRRTGSGSKGHIDIVAARQVAPHRFVQVIRVSGKDYLIGVGENIQLLSELDAPVPDALAADRRPSYPDFMQLLRDYSQRVGSGRQAKGERVKKEDGP